MIIDYFQKIILDNIGTFAWIFRAQFKASLATSFEKADSLKLLKFRLQIFFGLGRCSLLLKKVLIRL